MITVEELLQIAIEIGVLRGINQTLEKENERLREELRHEKDFGVDKDIAERQRKGAISPIRSGSV